MQRYTPFLALLVVTVIAGSALAPHYRPAPITVQDYRQLEADAERLYRDGSYARALEIYRQAASGHVPADRERWVRFRVADCSWRSAASSNNPDQSELETAREQLIELSRETDRVPDRDDVWAGIQTSLGDFWWANPRRQNWNQGWSHYTAALDYWAGSPSLEQAAARYLKIVRTMASPHGSRRYWGGAGHVPVDVLENAIRIAPTQEQPYFHYLLAQAIRHHGGTPRRQKQLRDIFETALAGGRNDDWYDDALFYYGDWLASQGTLVRLPQGDWSQQPDYAAALEIFRRIVQEFRPGETQYHDDATSRIDSITKPALHAHVGNVFLPGSEIDLHLSWRNVDEIELALHPVDLVADLSYGTVKRRGNGPGSWADQMQVRRDAVHTWTIDAENKGDYMPGQRTERLDERLPLGAYVLVAKAGTLTTRELVLVSDASVLAKTAPERSVIYCADAHDGSPIARTRVRVWSVWSSRQGWQVREQEAVADDDGLVELPRHEDAKGHHVTQYIVAANGDRQSLAQVGQGAKQNLGHAWKIYAFTDRPAYRPHEQVQWKTIARQWSAAGYTTPAGTELHYTVTDPRSAKVAEGTCTLNDFGSAWGEVAVTETMPLGEYRIAFYRGEGQTDHIGTATLFRLEEYKLPEFRVGIQTPERDGKPVAFRVGDTVQAEVSAEYYFGGAVAGATVEAVIYQKPFQHWWRPTRDYPWCYEPRHQYGSWYGHGQVISRETATTDANGQALITFNTPERANQDFEYRIEARVVDASRREVVGSDTVRVTRQLYYAYATPRSKLYQPGDRVQVDIRTIDANDQPVRTEGTVTVTRQWWTERWIDPDGNEVVVDQETPAGKRVRPGPGWELRFRGYEAEEILEQTVRTRTDGNATFTFEPDRVGYYRVAWRSLDQLEDQEDPYAGWVRAETMAWVCTDTSNVIGYQQGGLEIIADKDTFRAGETAPVMIATPVADRRVLFTIEGRTLHDFRLVHVEGNVKLVDVPIEQQHVPNVWLSAAMVGDHRLMMDAEPVTVPPVEEYLDVTVTADRSEYEPRETGMLTVAVADHEGRPVSAEVSLGLVDESVYAIQPELAGDPRAFFFTQRQPRLVQTGSTFQYKQFARLEKLPRDGRADADDDRRRYLAGAGGAWMQGGAVTATAEMAADDAPMRGRMRKDVPALSAPMPMESAGAPLDGLEADVQPGQGQAGQDDPAVQVRSDFRSTILWLPDVVTDEHGKATVEVSYADSLTGWKATARSATTGSRFGIGTTTTRTRKPLIARLQAPRFFVVGDTVTVSAVINNNTDEPLETRATLDAEGVSVLGVRRGGRIVPGAAHDVTVTAGRDARIDWQVRIESAGEAKLTLTAKSGKHADAMVKTYPMHEHGIEKFLAKSVRLRGDDVTVGLDIPSQRRLESTTMTVQIAPSLAVTMLDALPYLIDYPYGCTEQTMSRFLPAAIVARTMQDMGLDPDEAMGRVFGGVETRHVAATHPKGKRNLAELDAMIQQGLERLADFQHGDGGWGWWKHGSSDRFMTAYVLWGLSLARDAGLDVDAAVLDRAAAWLDRQIVEEEFAPDRQAWLLHALAVWQSTIDRPVGDAQSKALRNLFGQRDRLNAYTRSLLALSAHHLGDRRKAAILIENLANGVIRDDTPDASIIVRQGLRSNPAAVATAHWGADGVWWRWSDSPVESTSFALRAMLAIDPDHELIEPVTNWLIKNRRGAQWSNTRDTAITVLALDDYLRMSGELESSMTYELTVNGRAIATGEVNKGNILAAPSRFEIDTELIRDGKNEIRVHRTKGSGPLYVSAETSFFSLEEPVPAAGTGIFVRREYFKLVPQPTLLKGHVEHRVRMVDEDYVTSGERVEVVLTVESKNDYEYLVFEDLKPAGLEAVELRSGQPTFARELKSDAVDRAFGDGGHGDAEHDAKDSTGRTAWIHQELRDRNVALFIGKLPQGVWEIRYELRAEVPGHFHALPVMGHAMYVPEIRCNGDEVRMTVRDR